MATATAPKSGIKYPVEIWATVDTTGAISYSCTAELNEGQSSSEFQQSNIVAEGKSVEEAFKNLSSAMEKANIQNYSK